MLKLDLVEYNKFYPSVKFTLAHEGGYVNNPADPGGETKYGISKRAYPKEDIRNLSDERACEIYYQDYWTKLGCGSLDFPLCACVFDSAVNVGPSRAAQWLKQSGGSAETYLNLRADYYVSLAYHNPKMGQFLKGWLNRVADLRKLVATAQESPSQATV